MTRRGSLVAALAAALLLPGMASVGVAAQDATPMASPVAEASWLDGQTGSWNTAGMAIPQAPDFEDYSNMNCGEQERPAETPMDTALNDAGWKLFLAYQQGWGVTVVSGLAGYDGMCRPMNFQDFVFVDGVFAGTLSPEPMASRSDSALDSANLWNKDTISAQYRRYTADDALCCPSGGNYVEFTIDRGADGPVVNATMIQPAE
ncbi:MAG: LppP/LprE family lipoprotein [Thermomicrobiales bacterium]